MKKIFTIITMAMLIFVMGINNVKAQGCALSEGSFALNLGLGMGNCDYRYHNYTYDGFAVPTFNAAFDYAFLGNVINQHGSVSGGLYMGFGRGSKKDGGYKLIDGRWRIGTRGALHYTWVTNLDTYAGLSVGYRSDKYKLKDNNGNTSDSTPDSHFDCFGFAGARYDFGGIAVYSELAFTNFAFFQIGVAFMF